MTLPPLLDLVRPSLTSDSWGRYYTAPSISDVLINTLGHVKPQLIVELGVGQGSISGAAARRWKHARLVTVDADHSTPPTLIPDGRPKHRHFVHDALDDKLAAKIGVPFGSVDLGLCNPPYIRPRWRAGYGSILEEAGFSGALNSIYDAGADLLFIAQNLRLLKRNGKLGLILPDGLLTGAKFERVRSTLLRHHLVESVVQLPRRAFAGTDAQTHLMVLAKQGGETQEVALRNLSADGELSAPLMVPADRARQRLDYSYHHTLQGRFSRTTNHRGKTVRQLSSCLLRGAFSSNQLDSLSVPIFHLSDFPAAEIGQVPRVPSKFLRAARTLSRLPKNVRVASAGDILIARIGRNLHQKICLVEGGGCVISDCVYAIQARPEYREALIEFFCSESGRRALETAAHGVGAKYLSRADLLELIVPV